MLPSAEPPASTPVAPPFAVKLIVSLLVVFHLGCIIVNVSAAGATAPPILAKLYVRHGIISGYLGLIFQTNAYRFYAPDPGPCDLLWVRFKYADSADPRKEVVATRWYEVPDRDEHALRMPYQRDLAACMLLNMFVEPIVNPETPLTPSRQLHFTDVGRITFASYLRHLARQPRFATYSEPGLANPLVLIGMDAYKVAHGILNPIDVKLGLNYTDPRMYEVYFIGRYDPDGKRDGPEDEPFVPQYLEELFARIIQDDIQPAVDRLSLRMDDPAAFSAFVSGMGIPKPFRPTLLEDPTLVKPGQTRMQIAQRFTDAVQRGDNPRIREEYRLTPVGGGPQPNLFQGSPLNIPRSTAPGLPNQSLENRVTPQGRKPGTTIK
jgi:hypothetical protein